LLGEETRLATTAVNLNPSRLRRDGTRRSEFDLVVGQATNNGMSGTDKYQQRHEAGRDEAERI